MFKKVLSTQEMLDSQRSSHSTDSALFSLSQRQQHSQSNFSQVRTQDLFTQNQSSASTGLSTNTAGGSQSESSFPLTRKMSMYDKWMSKRPMFRKDESGPAGSGPVPRGGPQTTARGPTKDGEDRDLLQQVVNIVQDCNKEVKSTLIAVKEKLESGTENSGEKLTDTMKAFLEDLWRHEQRMLQAIEQGQKSQDKLHDLEKQLAAKEAVVDQLQRQLEDRDRDRDKPGDVKQLARAVRQELMSPQLAVENKLMEILEVTREVSEQQSEHMNQVTSHVSAQASDLKDWRTSHQKTLKDMEKRLQKDLESLRKELQKTQTDWSTSMHQQLTQAFSSHTLDLEEAVDRVASQLSKEKSDIKANTSCLVSGMKKELQQLMQKQAKAAEKAMQAAWLKQTRQQQQQIDSLHNTLVSSVNAELQQVLAEDRSRQDQDLTHNTALTAPAFEQRLEGYQADIKRQLQDMHHNYLHQVKQLQVQAQAAAKSTTTTAAATTSASRSIRAPVPLPLSDRSDFSGKNSSQCITTHTHTTTASGDANLSKMSSYRLQRQRGMSHISPLSDVDRENLFSVPKKSIFPGNYDQGYLYSSSRSGQDRENRYSGSTQHDEDVILSVSQQSIRNSLSKTKQDRESRSAGTSHSGTKDILRQSVQGNTLRKTRQGKLFSPIDEDSEVSFSGSRQDDVFPKTRQGSLMYRPRVANPFSHARPSPVAAVLPLQQPTIFPATQDDPQSQDTEPEIQDTEPETQDTEPETSDFQIIRFRESDEEEGCEQEADWFGFDVPASKKRKIVKKGKPKKKRKKGKAKNVRQTPAQQSVDTNPPMVITRSKLMGSGNTSAAGKVVTSANTATSGKVMTSGNTVNSGNVTSGKVMTSENGRFITSGNATSGRFINSGKAVTSGKVMTSGNAATSGKVMTYGKAMTSAPANQPSVYDFEDEQSPDRRPLPRIHLQCPQNNQRTLCSPSASTGSFQSSPALSLAIDTTEMIWVRRSRWQAKPDNPPDSGVQVRDMLSSPFLSGSYSQDSQPSPKQFQIEESQPQIRRTRGCRKRLL